jgi:hypothetical protein
VIHLNFKIYELYECLNVIDDDVCNATYCVNVNFECLNVIDDDVYDATYCENVNLMNVKYY